MSVFQKKYCGPLVVVNLLQKVLDVSGGFVIFVTNSVLGGGDSLEFQIDVLLQLHEVKPFFLNDFPFSSV